METGLYRPTVCTVLVNAARQPVDDKLVHFVSVVVLRAERCALRPSCSRTQQRVLYSLLT